MFTSLFLSFLVIMLFVACIAYVYDLIFKVSTKNSGSNNGKEVNNDEANVNATATVSPPAYKAVQATIAENEVERALRQLQENRYFVFRDLIVPSSSKSMSLTQIDHVVVSRKGIFCIETKSNKGNIYGFSRDESWKQYLGNSGKPYLFNSPFRQNKHHVSSLEMLLEGKLKAQVHSYIAFPNAKKVLVDSQEEDMSPTGVVVKIQRHTVDIYDDSDVEIIAKILAHAGSLREQLRDRHISEVREYIDAKVFSR